MKAPVRIAILGCGFAAQQIHIPRLKNLPELFSIVGVSDIVQNAAQQAAVMTGAPFFSNLDDLLDRTKPDAIAILIPLHADAIRKALDKNIDVFVEKPFCEKLDDAIALSDLAEKQKQVLVVGAMRTLDPAISKIKALIKEISPIRWVEVRDYCGQGSVVAVGSELEAHFFQSGLPVPEGMHRNLLQSLLLEFIHDVSILRGLFNGPFSCAHASSAPDGWSTTGELVLPGNIPCMFGFTEFGLPRANVFDVSLRIIGELGMIEIQFGDSNQPDRNVTIISKLNEDPLFIKSDLYSLEWQAFHEAIQTRQVSINSAKDGLEDMRLAWEIFTNATRKEYHI